MQENIVSLEAQLSAAGIDLSGPRGHSAVERFKKGEPIAQCVQKAQQHEAQARQIWLENVFEPWCRRHGLTRAQALSVAFFDDTFEPAHPEKIQVTMKDLFWAGGQHLQFAQHLRRTAMQAPATPTDEELLTACFEAGEARAQAQLAAHPELGESSDTPEPCDAAAPPAPGG